MFDYIRCSHCDKILAKWAGNGCIEIRNGKHCAVVHMDRADITCDRCGTRNIVLPRASETALKTREGETLRKGERESI